jgi:hypothetical protein
MIKTAQARPVNCAGCGRFIPWRHLAEHGGASWLFVPSSPFGGEEEDYHCKRCTAKDGPPMPAQGGVNLSVVTGKC